MLNRAEERFAIFNGNIYIFFKPVIIAILYQTNINIATLKYGLPHRKDKQNQNRMEDISSQKRAQSTTGVSLVLVIHIGELLCSSLLLFWRTGIQSIHHVLRKIQTDGKTTGTGGEKQPPQHYLQERLQELHLLSLERSRLSKQCEQQFELKNSEPSPVLTGIFFQNTDKHSSRAFFLISVQ